MRIATGFLTGTLVAALVGCGGTPGNRVSGTVTFDGRPVPAGKVYFKPDAEAGGAGATGFADIVAGRYDTGLSGARNVGTGPMVVMVEGIDPQAGPGAGGDSPDVTARLLFQGYELRADVPAGAFTLDIAVPPEAAAGAAKPAAGFISP
jgi:hypothetical protein